MAKVDNRGRPSYSPLEKAISECVKNTEAFNKIQLQFRAMVNFGDDPERNEELEDVVDARKSLAEQKDELTKKIREFSAKGDDDKKEHYEEERKIVDKKLRMMPPLGLTFDEWEDEEPEDEDMDRGRPSLEIEIKLVRAERAMNQSKALALKLMKKEGQDPKNLDALIEDQLNKDVKPGRPKSNELGKLDKRLIDVKRKIAEIESGEAEAKRKENAVYSDNGVLKGRKPKPLDELLLEYQNEAEGIVERIELLESKLDKQGKLERKLKLVRDKKRVLKKQLKEEGLTSKKILSNKEMKEIIQSEKSLTLMIKGEDGSLVTEKPLVDKKPKGKKAQSVAKAKKQELQGKNAEIDEQSESNSESSDILARINQARKGNLAVNG